MAKTVTLVINLTPKATEADIADSFVELLYSLVDNGIIEDTDDAGWSYTFEDDDVPSN